MDLQLAVIYFIHHDLLKGPWILHLQKIFSLLCSFCLNCLLCSFGFSFFLSFVSHLNSSKGLVGCILLSIGDKTLYKLFEFLEKLKKDAILSINR